MLSEAISGWARFGAASRSSSVISELPPVVMFMHRIAAALMLRQKLHEDVRIGRRLPGFGVARVQMQDRGAGLRGLDALAGDFFGRYRQVRTHRRRMDRARNGAGDDDLARSSSYPE